MKQVNFSQHFTLKTVLQKFKKINLTLNKYKCLFNKSEIVYIGHVISKEGIKPDKEKS